MPLVLEHRTRLRLASIADHGFASNFTASIAIADSAAGSTVIAM
jgi:hypothetical protein